jgi:hypothetical protein
MRTAGMRFYTPRRVARIHAGSRRFEENFEFDSGGGNRFYLARSECEVPERPASHTAGLLFSSRSLSCWLP